MGEDGKSKLFRKTHYRGMDARDRHLESGCGGLGGSVGAEALTGAGFRSKQSSHPWFKI